jgi:hypothetical protein
MKKLEVVHLENIYGGGDCATGTGMAVGAAAAFFALGAMTGGIGFLVGGGLTLYFGTGYALICNMGG